MVAIPGRGEGELNLHPWSLSSAPATADHSASQPGAGSGSAGQQDPSKLLFSGATGEGPRPSCEEQLQPVAFPTSSQ